MDVQFDPFSFAVAVVAVVISAMAFRVAKLAPLHERRRAYRDEARAALRDTIKFIADEVPDIRAGKHMDVEPFPIMRARETLQDVTPRLPESVRLTALGTTCGVAISLWHEVRHYRDLEHVAARREKSANGQVVHLSGQSSAATAQGYRDELDEARRERREAQEERDRATASLIKTMGLIRRDATTYVAWVDSQDRRHRSL